MAAGVPLGVVSGSNTRASSGDDAPREVWIAGLSQMGMRAGTPELMTDKIFETLKNVVSYQPDFVDRKSVV